jgi:hydroxylamine oxidation protein HaoB
VSSVQATSRGFRIGLLQAIGGMLLLVGSLLLIFGWPGGGPELKYRKLAEIPAGEADFPELAARYPAEKLTRYAISRNGEGSLVLNVADYRGDRGRPERAIVFPPKDEGAVGEGRLSQDDAQLRHDLWKSAADAILAHTGEDALFVSWWDNAQRIRFMTGRKVWLRSPVAGAFADGGQRRFWEDISGGFEQDEKTMRQWARWLTMDAEAALAEMSAVLPKDKPVYFLMCLDDLARLSEIESLSGITLPFEVRLFPSAGDVHAQIAGVKRWAHEKGDGAYLVQQLSGGAVRAWRITTGEGAKTLLARMLPFTTSLAKPLEKQALVYQSGWGGYLAIYQWKP